MANADSFLFRWRRDGRRPRFPLSTVASRVLPLPPPASAPPNAESHLYAGARSMARRAAPSALLKLPPTVQR